MSENAVQLRQAIGSEYARVAAALPGASRDWLRRNRTAAIERFLHTGLPTPADERWKYTDVAAIARQDYRLAARTESPATPVLLDRHDCFPAVRIVFNDGWLDERQSALAELPPGITVLPFGRAIDEGNEFVLDRLRAGGTDGTDGFQLLNDAFAAGGVFIAIAEHTRLSIPLHLLFMNGQQGGPTMSHPRVLVRCGLGSTAQIVESYVSEAAGCYFTNALTEIELGPEATLHHYRVQQEGAGAFHVGRLRVVQFADSDFTGYVVSAGAALARQDIAVQCRAPRASCRLRGLYLADGQQHVDHQVCIDHEHGHTNSDTQYRGVVNGRGRAVFNGRISVHRDAQKTSARLQNRNLLLSAKAEVNTKPELEIYADDVQCAHGATVGQLDAQALFYLRSRGVPEPVARSLLTFAFVDDLIEQLAIDGLRERLVREVLGQLPDARAIRGLL